MTKPLTQGELNRRANIRAMKAIGVKNAKLRAEIKAANIAAHELANTKSMIAALQRKDAREAAHAARNRRAKIDAEMMGSLPLVTELLLVAAGLTAANDDEVGYDAIAA